MIGRNLSHYKIVSNLGEGAMGKVYLAEDTKLGRQVALKIPPADLAVDPVRLQRYEREARAVAALNHPNIVTLHSIEEAEGVRFLTMEVVEGKNLAQLIPAEGLPLTDLFKLAIQITDALSVAHEAGITHRDLKPENIMVNTQGQVKILDFGLAKLRQRGPEGQEAEHLTRTLTQEGMVMGTVPYMSPEQVQGKPLDHRSDIFSLGVVLYEMATGERPFKGETAAHVISSILRDTPQSVTDLKTALPNHLGRLVKHCLEKDAERRFQTAKDVRNELEELRREVSSGGTRATGTVAVGKEPARRESVIRYAGLAVVVLVVGLAGLYIWPRGQERELPAVQAAPESARASIAVLPFANLSADEENEYFADGLTEELIHALANLEGLEIPARTSVFALRGKGLDVKEVGEKLGVESVLEGSVRKAGNRLRISVQLIKAADGFRLWSESYDREMEDVFTIQDEIAREIVDALRVRLSPTESRALQTLRPTDAEAYDFYLRGRGYFRRRTRESFEFARQMFSRAIEIDPEYAPAYAGLADCHTEFYRNYESTEANLDKADAASRKAVDLAPDLAEAHAARGYALGVQEQFTEAEKAFELAVRLNPRLPEAHYYYATISLARGEFEKSARLFEKATEVAPDDHRPLQLLPQVYRSLGRTEDVKVANRRLVELVERHLELDPDDVDALVRGANALADLGERERGLEWVGRVLETGTDDALLLYNIGCFYSVAGEVGAALDALEKSYAAGLADPAWMRRDSDLDPLRQDPRFEDLLARMESSES
jgi:non-specific serine/threonine protein kinase